jgi:hypothetical protein
LVEAGDPFTEWRYSPVRPATVALKASSPTRRQRERMSDRIMMAVGGVVFLGLLITIREVGP